MPDFVTDGGYPLEGLLSSSRLTELEPLSNWNSASERKDDHNKSRYTFFFPDEGCVDPSAAVRAFRQAAKDLSFDLQCGQKVTNIVCDDENGSSFTVESCGQDRGTLLSSNSLRTLADILTVISFLEDSLSWTDQDALNTRPTTGPWGTENCKRRRILVDEERASHVLQRRKGDVVVAGGGSRVEFGDSSTFISAVTSLEDQEW